MFRHWSLINSQKQKLWIGLTDRELAMALKLMNTEWANLKIHKQGDSHWSQNVNDLQTFLETQWEVFNSLTLPIDPPTGKT